MTLVRTVLILTGGLVLLLMVVILRADTTRLHYETSRCEQAEDEYRQQLVEADLELARLKNPSRIRQEIEDVVNDFEEEKPPPPPSPRRRDRH
jgi:hypothetical protein